MAATPNSLASLGSHSVGLARVSNFGPQTGAPTRLAIPKKPASGSYTYTAPGTSFSGGSGTGSIADYIAQAKALADQQVAAQVNAIKAQQTLASAQAAQRAHEINQAAAAAADYLQRTGLAGTLAGQDYQQAIGNQANLAQGFSGQLQHDAAAQTQQAQQSIGAVAGNTQQLSNKGDPLANTLYGLGGYLPGQALNVQGQGAVAAARAVPGATLGYGQQQAANALQTGAGTVQSLAAQIAQAQAQRPSITQNLIGQFSNAYNQAQSQALQAKIDQSLIDSRTAATANAAQQTRIAGKRVTDAETKYNNSQIPHYDASQSKDGVQRDQFGNPIANKQGFMQLEPGYHWEKQNGQTVPVKDAPPTTPQQQSTLARQWTATNHFQSDWQGNPLKGKLIPTAGYRVTADGTGVEPIPKPTKGSKASATANQPTSGSIDNLNSWLDSVTITKAPQQRWNSGTKQYEYWDPSSGTWGTTMPANSGPTYKQIVQQAITHGPTTGPKAAAWRKQAIAAVEARIPEGEMGRPYTTPALEQHAALQNATTAASKGVPWATALKTMVSSGYFPHKSVVLLALRQAYHLSGVRIPNVDLASATVPKKKSPSGLSQHSHPSDLPVNSTYGTGIPGMLAPSEVSR